MERLQQKNVAGNPAGGPFIRKLLYRMNWKDSTLPRCTKWHDGLPKADLIQCRKWKNHGHALEKKYQVIGGKASCRTIQLLSALVTLVVEPDWKIPLQEHVTSAIAGVDDEMKAKVLLTTALELIACYQVQLKGAYCGLFE